MSTKRPSPLILRGSHNFFILLEQFKPSALGHDHVAAARLSMVHGESAIHSSLDRDDIEDINRWTGQLLAACDEERKGL